MTFGREPPATRLCETAATVERSTPPSFGRNVPEESLPFLMRSRNVAKFVLMLPAPNPPSVLMRVLSAEFETAAVLSTTLAGCAPLAVFVHTVRQPPAPEP